MSFCKPNPALLTILISEYAAGASLRELVRRYPVSRQSIRRWLGELGIPMRSRIEALQCTSVDVSITIDKIEEYCVSYQNETRERKKQAAMKGAITLVYAMTLPDKKPDERSWGYIAGCLDSEGSILKKKTIIEIEICQNDRSMLDWICETIGAGRIRRRSNDPSHHKHHQHILTISRQIYVYYVLLGTFPSLTVKKQLALATIQHLEDRYDFYPEDCGMPDTLSF